METNGETRQPAVFASEEGTATPAAAGTVYKCTIWSYLDSVTAKDVVQVTPHFRDDSGTLSAAQIATQRGTACATSFGPAVAGGVKLYLEDYTPAAPPPPLAQ